MAKMTTRQRRRKLEQCGAGCFGDAHGPKAKRAGHPRYPVCGRGCDPDCKSVKDAYMRASQQHERKIAKKMKALGRRMGCDWAEG